MIHAHNGVVSFQIDDNFEMIGTPPPKFYRIFQVLFHASHSWSELETAYCDFCVSGWT